MITPKRGKFVTSDGKKFHTKELAELHEGITRKVEDYKKDKKSNKMVKTMWTKEK